MSSTHAQSPSGRVGEDRGEGARGGTLRWRDAALLVVVCAAVYFFGLSWRSLASSEGHRVAPAWEMLDRASAGEADAWWRVTMFGQTYLRKPPGMPWAIAAATKVMGRTEFAARSVSAVSMVLGTLAVWWLGSRWFGTRGGLAAGLAWALMPLLWAGPSGVGRTAEIESLHNLGVLLLSLAVVDSVARGRAATRGMERTLVVAAGVTGLVIAVLAKGPAGAGVIAGVCIGAAMMRMWTWRAIANVGAMAVLGAAVLAPIAWKLARVSDASGDDAITQGAGEFLWSAGVGRVAMLLPAALVSALPASLAMLLVWGRSASDEARAGGDAAERMLRIARLLGVSWVASLVVMMIAGVSNPRYAMPAASLLAAMWGFVGAGAWGESGRAWFGDKRAGLSRALLLGGPRVLPTVLVAAGLAAPLAMQQFRKGIDGREAGQRLAQVIASSARAEGVVEVWADGLVEARPDVLLYAMEQINHGAPRMGTKARWKKQAMQNGELPPTSGWLVLRSDADGDERGRYAEAIASGRLVEAGSGEVGRYRFIVYGTNPR